MEAKYSSFSEYLEDLRIWEDRDLYPALYDCLDEVFPELHLTQRKGSGSNRNYWEGCYHIDKQKDSAGSNVTRIYRNSPYVVVDFARGSKNVLALYRSYKNLTYFEACRELSKICNIDMPQYNGEKGDFESYKEKQEIRVKAQEIFVSALWSGSDEANKVLNYLRDKRHFTDEDIKQAGFGYVDQEVLKELPEYKEVPAQKGAGSTHRLTLPYYGGSTLYGFKFRYTAGGACDPKDKYLNSSGGSVSSDFYGMTLRGEDLVIVEGELCAIHAKLRGAKYVVSTAGGAVKEGQVTSAIKRGVKRFTLLFDNDERGQSFIQPSIDKIESQGGEVFVASLPTDCKDTDEYLRDHTIEDWQGFVKVAVPSCEWKVNKVIEKYAKITQEEGIITMKQREDFFSEIGAIVNSPATAAHNREYIYSLLIPFEQDLKFKVDDIKTYLDQEYYRSEAVKRSEATKQTLSQVQDLVRQNKIDEAVKLMRTSGEELSAMDRSLEYAEAFRSITPQEYTSLLSGVNKGLPTGISFRQDGQEEKLTLNTGLSFICGYSGHFKTTLLNNIALNEAKRVLARGKGESVVYFSYEIAKSRLLLSLLNLYVNDKLLTANPYNKPVEAIAAYFNGDNSLFNRGEYDREETHLARFERLNNRFYSDIVGGSNAPLRIVDKRYSIEDLVKAVKNQMAIVKPSLICIDYAQLLTSEEASRQRTEEIKKVVIDLNNLSQSTGIPFLLAAQMNRQINSPLDLETTNIGEGSDIEKIADTCIGIYNLSRLHPVDDKKQQDVLSVIHRAGLPNVTDLSPIRGQVFLRIMKRRFGINPIDTILPIEGRTSYIELNDKDQFKDGEQLNLDF